MTKSFFGGDPSVSHYSVGLRYKAHKDELRSERDERRRNERATIVAAGFKSETYFQFRNKDEAGKAIAKAKADELAANIEAQTSVKMDVCEGCFL